MIRRLLTLAVLTLLVAACRGERTDAPPRQFFPGLDDQQRWDPQEETEFYTDHRTAREPVAGTVAFGWWPNADDPGRSALLREDDALYRGLDANGAYVARAPIEALLDGDVTPQRVADLIARGRERYDIYCSSCHGKTGLGDGVVGLRWSNPIPSYHAEQYEPGGEKGQDGYLFHTIRNGVPNAAGQLPALKMPSYAERVSPHDAWAIVLYMRSLQRARSASLTDVPEAERGRLQQTRGAVPANSIPEGANQ